MSYPSGLNQASFDAAHEDLGDCIDDDHPVKNPRRCYELHKAYLAASQLHERLEFIEPDLAAEVKRIWEKIQDLEDAEETR